jgi:hypothetical protein
VVAFEPGEAVCWRVDVDGPAGGDPAVEDVAGGTLQPILIGEAADRYTECDSSLFPRCSHAELLSAAGVASGG